MLSTLILVSALLPRFQPGTDGCMEYPRTISQNHAYA